MGFLYNCQMTTIGLSLVLGPLFFSAYIWYTRITFIKKLSSQAVQPRWVWGIQAGLLGLADQKCRFWPKSGQVCHGMTVSWQNMIGFPSNSVRMMFRMYLFIKASLWHSQVTRENFRIFSHHEKIGKVSLISVFCKFAPLRTHSWCSNIFCTLITHN